MYRIVLIIPTLILSSFVFSQKKNSPKNLEKSDAILKVGLQKNVNKLTTQHNNDDNSSTIAFIAATYKSIGLQPFIDSSNYIQPFTLDLGKEIKPSTSFKINGVTLETGTDFWPLAFCPNGFFTGTAIWGSAQPGQPFLYDLKPVLIKNKAFSKLDLIQHIKEKASELAAKKISAILVYNSSDVNDSLGFAANDTSSLTVIPVIYFTKNGIKKLKNESTIAIAMDAHVMLDEKIVKGKNVVAYLNNGAANTVVIAASNNNLISTATKLELAKLLKTTCNSAKKNQNGLMAADYMNNNYLFMGFDDIYSTYFGSQYFFEHLPPNIEKINYAINIDVIGGTTDTTNFLKIKDSNTSLAWSGILQNIDPSFNIKIDSTIINNLCDVSFCKNGIPVICLLNPVAEKQQKLKPVINTNDVRTINYITQLISSANNKGKLPFNKADNNNTTLK